MKLLLKLKLLALVRIHLFLNRIGHCYHLAQRLWGKTVHNSRVLWYHSPLHL